VNALALDDIVKHFPDRSRPVLDGVRLAVAAGETVGIVGVAGAGKSVLLKIAAGLLPADRGTVEIAGVALRPDSDERARSEARSRVGMLFQNNALFDFLTVADNIAFPLERGSSTSAEKVRARVAEALRGVGLLGSEEKLPSQLSGGMKKRAALARAVVARPPLLLFDEPTAGLDPVTTAKILDLLRREREESGAALVIVSSDVDMVRGFAPRLALLHDGKLRYDGPSAAAADSPDPVVRQLVRGDVEGPL
jgi:phospholipid/cholesterol/gamma-HCH transport system ATP-binding protein